MNKPTLRSLTARLAVDDAELRPGLVRLLRKATGNTSVVQQPPIVITQPPIIAQQEAAPMPMPIPMMMPVAPPQPVYAPTPAAPVYAPTALPAPAVAQVPAAESVIQVPEAAPSPAAVGAMFVTERTQKGFEADLMPEMERLLSQGMGREQVAQYINGLIAEAFSIKNHLYNILIRHQATFEGDTEYRNSLERLVQAWVTDTVDSGG